MGFSIDDPIGPIDSIVLFFGKSNIPSEELLETEEIELLEIELEDIEELEENELLEETEELLLTELDEDDCNTVSTFSHQVNSQNAPRPNI